MTTIDPLPSTLEPENRSEQVHVHVAPHIPPRARSGLDYALMGLIGAYAMAMLGRSLWGQWRQARWNARQSARVPIGPYR